MENVISLKANSTSTSSQVAKAVIGTHVRKDKRLFDKAVGLVLGVANVTEVIQEQESVLVVSEETDLIKEAYFDINAFIL